MRNTVIVLLGLICVLGAAESIFAANKQEIGIFTELQSIDGSDFGKKLLDTITLQLKSKAPLGEISRLLKQIETELTEQQRKDDANHNEEERTCAKRIAQYEAAITQASATIHDEQFNIRQYERAIQLGEGQKASHESTIKVLSDREDLLRKTFKEDQDDHAKRIAQQKAVIDALTQIIPELERLRPHGNVQQALVELAKIGRANPIGALLQVAMTLDAGALQRVIQHLQKLKKSVEASIADDENSQRTAEANFKAMMDELAKQKAQVKEALARTVADIEANKSKKAASEKALKTARKDRKLAQDGKQKTTAACDEKRSRYNAQKASRQKEIDIVNKVLTIIATKLMTMQEYIKKRVDA
jgi:chromosome segregation ATPase